VTGHQVAYADGAWVATDDGPVHVAQGEPLPDNALEKDVARLADAGLLEGIDAVPAGDDDGVVAGSIDEIKVRVGDDPDKARAYLETENAAKRPRPTLVAHLESIVGDDTGDGTSGPATPSPLIDPTGI
jgi:hypothetical protein